MRRAVLAGIVLWASGSGAAAQRFGGPTHDGRAPFACAAPPASPAPPVSATPSRTAVVEAMNAISAAMSECAGAHASVYWSFSFRGSDGAATEVRLGPIDDGALPTDAELRCMELVACGARLPPFERDSFTVNYPFRI